MEIIDDNENLNYFFRMYYTYDESSTREYLRR